jgi:hypothetical protein
MTAKQEETFPDTEPVSGEVVHFATRDEILGFDDKNYEAVEVPEWGKGVVVRVRSLTGSERDSWEASMLQDNGKGRRTTTWIDARAKLIVRCMVDGDGNRLFTDADTKAVGQKSSAALQRIFEVAQRLSRLTDEDVEEVTKASSDDQSASNGSGSPPTSEYP